jgi:hypothetical protein
VLEAHICSVPGSPRKYVHFIARGQGTILSVVLTKRGSESLPARKFVATRAPAGADLYIAQLEGFSVAGFESSKYFGFVVSDLDRDKVLQIGTALGPALRTALDSRTSGPTLGLTKPASGLTWPSGGWSGHSLALGTNSAGD